MRTDLFDFELPADSIALRPASPRDSARHAGRAARRRACATAVLPIFREWLEPGDQLVVNDTRVISAQLKGRRIGRDTEPKIEATLIKRLDGSRWQALVKPAKKLSPGDVVRFGNEGKVCLLGHLDAQVEHKGDDGEITLSFSFHGPALDSCHRRSRQPAAAALHRLQARARRARRRRLPDHVRGPAKARSRRRRRDCILRPRWKRRLRERGVGIHRITLHVGAGTFLPVKAEDTTGHKMHSEWGSISAETADALNAARASGGRIVAVGTTSLRLSGKRRRGRRHDRAVHRRDRDLHHAGLSFSRGRYSPDQFSPAAFDAVHAGVGVQRPRDHEAGLCPRDRERLPVLFLWRRLPAVSR